MPAWHSEPRGMKKIKNREVKSCVIIPAYNEETIIGKVVKGVLNVSRHVIVVDDGSTDCTVKKVLDYPVTLLRHPINLGQGAALQTGFDYAITQPVDFLVTFDADGQHTPEEIPYLVDICQSGGYDVVLGSRFVRGGVAVSIMPERRLMLKLATLFTRWTTGLIVTDTHNGFRVFTKKAASQVHINHNGMAHASEILSQIAQLKLKYTEAPVTVHYTAYSKKKGQSILNAVNILWDIWTERLK
jgi:glycosyltransferase involved in cell wall biosynthesis